VVYYLPLFYLTPPLEGKKWLFWPEAAEYRKKILELSRFCNFISHLHHKVGYIYTPEASS